MTLKKSEKI